MRFGHGPFMCGHVEIIELYRLLADGGLDLYKAQQVRVSVNVKDGEL